jgi:hypothetical protein
LIEVSLVLSLVHGTNQYERNHNGYQAIFNDRHRGLVGNSCRFRNRSLNYTSQSRCLRNSASRVASQFDCGDGFAVIILMMSPETN